MFILYKKNNVLHRVDIGFRKHKKMTDLAVHSVLYNDIENWESAWQPVLPPVMTRLASWRLSVLRDRYRYCVSFLRVEIYKTCFYVFLNVKITFSLRYVLVVCPLHGFSGCSPSCISHLTLCDDLSPCSAASPASSLRYSALRDLSNMKDRCCWGQGSNASNAHIAGSHFLHGAPSITLALINSHGRGSIGNREAEKVH